MIKKILGYFAVGAMAIAAAFGGVAATSVVTAEPAQAYTSTYCFTQKVYVKSTTQPDRVEYWRFCRLLNGEYWYQMMGHSSYLEGMRYWGMTKPPNYTTVYLYI